MSTQKMADDLKLAKRQLTDRLGATSDQAEIKKIEQELADLEIKIDRVVLAGLNDAAAIVADAADDLLAVVRSARTGPLDGYLNNIGQVIGRIRVQIEEAVDQTTGEARPAPKTEDPELDRSLPPPRPTPASTPTPAQPVAGVPDVTKSKKFPELKGEYEAAWSNCQINPDKRSSINDLYVAKLNVNKARYEQAASEFHGMPWFFPGIIHAMETGFKFDRHLHNGDPLTARTVRVPKGRPLAAPPFAWEDSARDAMTFEDLDKVTDWSEPHLLYLWEQYNGFGYRFKGLRTPYLWSFSNLCSKGRYVADGVFDENAVSKQCGAAVMLKALLRG